MTTDPALLAALEWAPDDELGRDDFLAGWRARERHREGDTLPLDQVPEGWFIEELAYSPDTKTWTVVLREDKRYWGCSASYTQEEADNPKLAVLAAIAKVGG